MTILLSAADGYFQQQELRVLGSRLRNALRPALMATLNMLATVIVVLLVAIPIPVSRLRGSLLQRQIGYLGQDPLLVHGTLRENICFADFPVAASQLQQAVTTSCFDEGVASGEIALSTVVGERGHTLTAGQKVRVALARAIQHTLSILILDEINAVLEPLSNAGSGRIFHWSVQAKPRLS